MEVVLLKSVDNLGQAGEKVDVKRGYFRNFLEPRLMALVANEANLKLVESKKKQLEAMVARETKDAEKIKALLDGQKLEFKLRAGDRGQLFGSVTSRDVADAIKEKLNVEIERRRIDMENLRTLGDHPVRIRIYTGVTATLNAHIDRLIVEGEELEGLEAASAAPAAAEAVAEEAQDNE
ncbi:MAG TPA: 50S ribosomal protein L9 [Candidatus Sumerlaeota bacterium]|nr:50S ribosomal protein L9 [Candidatus Sumerlaeota bacterium]